MRHAPTVKVIRTSGSRQQEGKLLWRVQKCIVAASDIIKAAIKNRLLSKATLFKHPCLKKILPEGRPGTSDL